MKIKTKKKQKISIEFIILDTGIYYTDMRYDKVLWDFESDYLILLVYVCNCVIENKCNIYTIIINYIYIYILYIQKTHDYIL